MAHLCASMMGTACGSSPSALKRVHEAMKKKITLTIEEEHIEVGKKKAEEFDKTLSKFVEDYFHLLGVKLRDDREKEERKA